ncbi:MAG: hypothetical protein ACRCU2_08490, partial [Planktothrix sp.]
MAALVVGRNRAGGKRGQPGAGELVGNERGRGDRLKVGFRWITVSPDTYREMRSSHSVLSSLPQTA